MTSFKTTIEDMFKYNFGGHVTKEQLKPVLMQPPLFRGHPELTITNLSYSLDRSNYQILLCDLSVQIIFVLITTQDIQFLSAFLVFFFALLVWFIVVVGTNIVNHYHFIPLIGTTSSGISNQLRDIYPGTAGMLLHIKQRKTDRNCISWMVIGT
jgi:glucan phosphoethanolaminetransferase (alkaline phosphatase superfamily)